MKDIIEDCGILFCYGNDPNWNFWMCFIYPIYQ